ncbi:hypothetical protein [Paraflavitalea pollutisoli]|uniref:hypothetical protein n=1 Tax=Paraflavitalea pollutisoli TaxID=3034143 RepID=UPI0023EAC564|nr:hypothetical protein [Paraflavitalea sp. H1-2-19X]
MPANSKGGLPSVPVIDARPVKEVMEEFFTNYHPDDAEKILWEWLVAALTRDHSIYSNAKERANLIFFYENLKELISTMWLVHHSKVLG